MATSMIGRTQFFTPQGAAVGSDDTTESGQVIFISESVPSNQTNLEFGSFAFLNSKLKAFAIHAGSIRGMSAPNRSWKSCSIWRPIRKKNATSRRTLI